VVELRVPDIGEFDEVEVVEVLVKPGDEVERDASLVTIESDKASMDLPAPVAGRLQSLDVAVGDMVAEGDLVALILSSEAEAEAEAEEVSLEAPAPEVSAPSEAPAAEASDAPREALHAPASQPPDLVSAPEPAAAAAATPSRSPRSPMTPGPPLDAAELAHGELPHASPSIRRFARELGVDLVELRGTGPKGRILRQDVQAHVKDRLAAAAAGGAQAAPTPVPSIDFSRFGEVETVPLSRIRKVAKNNLHRSWLAVPHVTQHEIADITEMESFRKSLGDEAARRGVKVTPLPFLMKSCAAALAQHPRVNSSLSPDGEALIYKHYCHIGVAVDTDDGLVVPVVRDVDRKGLFELATELAEVSARAREGKLRMQDLQGASFTISSLGGIGGSFFTPIVNSPEAAILGVSRATLQPTWREGEVVPRLLLPLSLSYDHRIVDGAEAVRFTTRVASLLGDLRELLL
jgi:pyruvate dehydrogenase E2 component (dihydrolipoamide acetyltransferase)